MCVLLLSPNGNAPPTPKVPGLPGKHLHSRTSPTKDPIDHHGTRHRRSPTPGKPKRYLVRDEFRGPWLMYVDVPVWPWGPWCWTCNRMIQNFSGTSWVEHG